MLTWRCVAGMPHDPSFPTLPDGDEAEEERAETEDNVRDGLRGVGLE